MAPRSPALWDAGMLTLLRACNVPCNAATGLLDFDPSLGHWTLSVEGWMVQGGLVRSAGVDGSDRILHFPFRSLARACS